MNKIIIIGCPGSGKSYFSKELAKKTNFPLYHLDLLYWNKDKTIIEKSIFLEKVRSIFKNDNWIIDGNYQSSMEERIIECDTIFFLDYDLDVCLKGISERFGKPRSDLPWIEEEYDEEFINYIKNFQVLKRPEILILLEKYQDKKIYIFKDRIDSVNFLENL